MKSSKDYSGNLDNTDFYGEEPMKLLYNPQKNIFVDECGFVIYNIYEFVDPNTIFLFKEKKEFMHVEYNGRSIDLIYDEWDDQYYVDLYPLE